MTDTRYDALCERLDQLQIDLDAGDHARAIEGLLRLQAVFLGELEVMQHRLDGVVAQQPPHELGQEQQTT
jgi:hypothetical protein